MLGGEENRFELKLTFDGEVLDSEVVFPIVGEGLVELAILVNGNLLGVTGPDGLGLVAQLQLFLDLLGLVAQLPLFLDLLDLLGLLLLLLGLFLLVSFLLLLFLGLIVSDLLLFLLGGPELDGVLDEFGVLLHQFLNALLLKVLGLVFLQGQHNLGTTAERLSLVASDSEGTPSTGLPDVLLVIVVLGGDGDLVSNEVGRVETDTKLTNHGEVSLALLDGLHEPTGSRASNGTQVLDEVSLGHTNTSIKDGQGLGVGVRGDADLEGLRGGKLFLVGETNITDLVKSIGTVRDQLTKKDFLVAVESVDNKAHQLIDLSLECELFNLFGHGELC